MHKEDILAIVVIALVVFFFNACGILRFFGIGIKGACEDVTTKISF